MKKRFLFEVKKGGEIIGNSYQCYDITDESVLLLAMTWTREIIFNYNKNLASCDLDDRLLVIRILQEEDEGGNRSSEKAILRDMSENYILNTFKYFDLYGAVPEDNEVNERYGLIAVLNSDIEANREKYDIQVVIDLDDHIINFNYKFTELESKSWLWMQDQKNIPELKVCSYNFKKLSINELDDARIFVDKNRHGWISTDAKADLITMPF